MNENVSGPEQRGFVLLEWPTARAPSEEKAALHPGSFYHVTATNWIWDGGVSVYLSHGTTAPMDPRHQDDTRGSGPQENVNGTERGSGRVRPHPHKD